MSKFNFLILLGIVFSISIFSQCHNPNPEYRIPIKKYTWCLDTNFGSEVKFDDNTMKGQKLYDYINEELRTAFSLWSSASERGIEFDFDEVSDSSDIGLNADIVIYFNQLGTSDNAQIDIKENNKFDITFSCDPGTLGYWTKSTVTPNLNGHLCLGSIILHEVGHIFYGYGHWDESIVCNQSPIKHSLTACDEEAMKKKYNPDYNVTIGNEFSGGYTGGSIKVNNNAVPSGSTHTWEEKFFNSTRIVEAVNQDAEGYFQVFANFISNMGGTPTGNVYTINYANTGFVTAKFGKQLNVQLNNGPFVYDGVTYSGNPVVLQLVENFNYSITVLNTESNYVENRFESWADNGSTNNQRTITPTSSQTSYTVNRKKYALTNGMNIHFTHSMGENITLQFNDHSDGNVTQYKVYRKVKNVPGETLIATRSRGAGTHTVVDPQYKLTNAAGSVVLQYNVRAYYSPDQTWSDADAYDYTTGENVGPDFQYNQDFDNQALAADIEIKENNISNFPNPFNPTTKIEYSIKANSNVKIVVYNMLGQEIRTLVNSEKSAGTYYATFDASGLPSGMYYCKMVSNNFNKTIKMLLTK